MSYLNLIKSISFQFYHKKKCNQCDKIPKDPAVCLICGSLVCMRENCCRKNIIGNQVSEDGKIFGLVVRALDSEIQ